MSAIRLLYCQGMANKHTRPQQEFIVRKLAAFEPPRSIVLDFMAVFTDTKCDENDVRRLDPANAPLSFDLHALFLRERERVLADPRSAPFADQKARLVVLSNDVLFFRSNNQLAEAAARLRQIAEETGAIGSKGTGKAAPTAGETPEFRKIEVTRTVVYPAPAVTE
jgi:hypothetical protein